LAGAITVLSVALIAGCSDGVQPFAKSQVGSATQVSDLKPPPENYVIAGPGAEHDIDYETVYGPGHTGPMTAADQSAVQDEPLDKITEGPGTEHTASMVAEGNRSSPMPDTGTSNKKRRAIGAVSVLPVRGAPGKGNAELTAALREALSSAGWPVLRKAREDALTITGKVNLGPDQQGIQQVAIVWSVASPDGRALGVIKQANRVPAGSLDSSWGETASYAAQAAATGIFDLVKKLR
jgi:hypothetical protein